MKRVLLLALVVMMIASVSYAQGFIGLYADPEGLECRLEDAGAPHLCPVYLVLRDMEARYAELRIDTWNAPHLGVPLVTTWNQPYIMVADGETVFSTGVGISFGACETPPILLGTFTYYCQGSSISCEYMEVFPTDYRANIVIADCTMPVPNFLIATGGRMVINDDGHCTDPWGDEPLARCGLPTPVAESSWGQIKALYTD